MPAACKEIVLSRETGAQRAPRLFASRSPRRFCRPPICQAGGSARGQDFAARWADTIITEAGSVDAMKDYREGVRRRARAAGRDPDSIKVLFLAYPLVDTTMEAARERQRLMRENANRHLDLALSSMSRLTNIDFRGSTGMSRYRSCPPTVTNHRWPDGSARRRGKSPSANPPRPASISPGRSTTSPA